MITLDQNKKRVTIKKKTDIETHPRKSVMESPIIKKKKDFKDQSTQVIIFSYKSLLFFILIIYI